MSSLEVEHNFTLSLSPFLPLSVSFPPISLLSLPLSFLSLSLSLPTYLFLFLSSPSLYHLSPPPLPIFSFFWVGMLDIWISVSFGISMAETSLEIHLKKKIKWFFICYVLLLNAWKQTKKYKDEINESTNGRISVKLGIQRQVATSGFTNELFVMRINWLASHW